MSVYARSDMMAVSIPVTDGGCGQIHTRPVVDGAPAKIWRLTCPQCEASIKEDIARSSYTMMTENGTRKVHVNNGTWSDNQLKIPLTPDESEVAAEMEKSGQTIMHQVAEGMSRQAIENMQRQQAQVIEEAEAKAAATAATERVAQLEAQLAEMYALLKSVTASDTGAPQVAVRAPETATRARAVHNPGPACETCGGPLRVPGAKGPTPKRMCYNCRAAALKQKAS